MPDIRDIIRQRVSSTAVVFCISIYIYIYIYTDAKHTHTHIYMCVRVCVCVCVSHSLLSLLSNKKFHQREACQFFFLKSPHRNLNVCLTFFLLSLTSVFFLFCLNSCSFILFFFFFSISTCSLVGFISLCILFIFLFFFFPAFSAAPPPLIIFVLFTRVKGFQSTDIVAFSAR